MNREEHDRHEHREIDHKNFSRFSRLSRLNLLRTLPFLFAVFAPFAVKITADIPFSGGKGELSLRGKSSADTPFFVRDFRAFRG